MKLYMDLFKPTSRVRRELNAYMSWPDRYRIYTQSFIFSYKEAWNQTVCKMIRFLSLPFIDFEHAVLMFTIEISLQRPATPRLYLSLSIWRETSINNSRSWTCIQTRRKLQHDKTAGLSYTDSMQKELLPSFPSKQRIMKAHPKQLGSPPWNLIGVFHHAPIVTQISFKSLTHKLFHGTELPLTITKSTRKPIMRRMSCQSHAGRNLYRRHSSS